MTAANQFIELGLKDLGYEYINSWSFTLRSLTPDVLTAPVDDCYSVKTGRDSKTKRIQPDLDKFPDGISGLAEEIHDKGLKVGIYSSTPSTPTFFPTAPGESSSQLIH